MVLTKDDIFEYCKNHSSTNCSDGKKYIELSRLKEELTEIKKHMKKRLCNPKDYKICDSQDLCYSCFEIENQFEKHFGDILKDEVENNGKE